MKNKAGYKMLRRNVILSFFVLITMTAYSQNFNYRLYTMKDGLPGLDVSAILIDSRGYLWMSSYGGLSRFDGSTFKNYGMSDGLPQYSGTYNFIEDSIGRIWFVFKSGVGFFDGKKFVSYPIENPPDQININEIFETKHHKMRFVSFKGIYELQNRKWKRLNLFPGHPDLIYNYAEELEDGSLMINCLDSIVKLNKDGHSETIIKAGRVEERFKTLIKTGGQIFTSNLNHLYLYKDNHFELIHDDVLKDKDIYFEFIDSKKRLWVGTISNGIFVFDNNNSTVLKPDLQSSFQHINPKELNLYQINKFTEDYEGNIWATTSNGLLKLTPSYVDFYNDYNRPFNKYDVRSAFKDKEGTLYFGHTKGGFTIYKNNKFTDSKDFLDKTSSELIDNWVQSFCVDEKNHLWLFTNDNNVVRIVSNHAENMSDKWNMHPGSSPMIYNPDDSTIYTANPYGITKIKNDNFKTDTLKDLLGDKINSFSLDSIGNLWFSTFKGKIFMRNRNGTYTRMNATLGIDNIFLTLHWINKSTLCIATNGLGIFKYHRTDDNKFINDCHLTIKDGLPSDIIMNVTNDNKNTLWVSTITGLVEVTFTGILNNESNTQNKEIFSINKYGEQEGFNNKSCYYACLVTDNNNNVWYGTDEYLARIPINQIIDDTAPPIIHIENISLFYSNTNWDKFTNTFSSFFHLPVNPTMPYNQNDITIDYKAITFGNENNIEYAYKCEGIDTGWINNGANTHLSYVNLQSGNYKFQVRAKKPHSTWSNNIAIFMFTINPPFWATWWFRTLILLFIAVIVYAIYRFRINQLMQLQEIRNKIASNLHDDIGSTLNSISIFSEVARQDAVQRDEALLMIGESSRQVIEVMSDIVWSINPKNDSFEKIIFRMKSLSYNLLNAKKIDFIFKADEQLNKKKISMQNRRNFYLIFKEAINNLVKYSEATRVSINISCSDNHIKMKIQDNGIGFDKSIPSSGNGLNNMQRRANEMNANLKIKTAKGEGTTIELTIKSN